MTMTRRRCHTHKSLSAPNLGALALDRIAQPQSPLQLLAKQTTTSTRFDATPGKGEKGEAKGDASLFRASVACVLVGAALYLLSS